jgi:hypothetical protein
MMTPIAAAPKSAANTLEDELEDEFPNSLPLKAVIAEVKTCIDATMQDPCIAIAKGHGVALAMSSDRTLVSFQGDLVSADRVITEAGCKGLQLVREAMNWLRKHEWIEPGLLPPCEALANAAAAVEGRKAPLSPLTATNIVAGDLRAGALLYQIRFWARHARVVRWGRAWIVKTREEWCAETALTRHQYDPALKKLRERSLVRTKRGHSGIYQGRTVTHLWPNGYIALGRRSFAPGGQG